MSQQTRLTEKATRASDARERQWEEVIGKYLAEMEKLPREAARSHRFSIVVNELLGCQPGLIEDFVSGIYDEVYIAFTNFHNTLRQEPVVRKLLPIEPAHPEVPMAADYIFEPDPYTILGEVLRGLTELQILQAVYEAIASEQSARMVAMRNATEAATDLIGELTLSYNNARQESITKELLDIVGGASALTQAKS